uniref:DNA polymerase V subunit UmuC n=1 Tax=Klebsiella pneumoniae TaxID=573 RepID=A0A2P1BQ20_KLEPN|nr:DNA polymerase V subunit UmuC [Klebsiella pneumoniae]
MFAYSRCEQLMPAANVFPPDLKGKPVVVLSNNDGCVIARSAEAKRIKMGTPWFQMKTKDTRKKYTRSPATMNFMHPCRRA